MENLTVKEREIMDLVVQGKSNQELCNILNIAMTTVKTHLHNIYAKYGISSDNKGNFSVSRLRAALKYMNLL